MRKLSITTKITIWYTIFLLLLTGGVLFILTYTGNMRASEIAKTRLVDSVNDASDEIETVGKDFIIDDNLNFYDDGIYLGVYDGEEELLEGRRPAELSSLPELKDEYMNTVKGDDDNIWYVYDRLFELNGNPIWVRGILKDDAAQSTFSYMLKISATAFPILMILAALGGYIITRRAFRPVRKILDTVEEISRDGDLSKRIDLGHMQRSGSVEGQGHAKNQRFVESQGTVKGQSYDEIQNHAKDQSYDEVQCTAESGAGDTAKDEIHKLAYTFNNMFDKLEKSFEEQKQFTSDVSHELRTPLAVIISQSDYAKEDEEYRQHALEVINREAKRMAGLVNRLLTIARSDSGRLKIDREIVDLSSLCESVAEQQRPIADEKNMRIYTHIERGIKVSGDEEMLIRVLLNLVDNAIKYGKPEAGSKPHEQESGYRSQGKIGLPYAEDSRPLGGRDESAEQGTASHIKLTLEKKDSFACFSVEDDGPGIAAEHLERIWERFYRADTSRNSEGSGLGLSMVAALVKAHGGKVETDSRLGKGSCFSVYIPLA